MCFIPPLHPPHNNSWGGRDRVASVVPLMITLNRRLSNPCSSPPGGHNLLLSTESYSRGCDHPPWQPLPWQLLPSVLDRILRFLM